MGMDKVISAVYNASYTAGSHLRGHRFLRDDRSCHDTGPDRAQGSFPLFVLQ